MKIIKFLLKSVSVMFVFLFSLFFVYIYNDNKIIKNEIRFIEVSNDNVTIEPEVVLEEVETPEELVVEPVASNNQKVTESVNKFYYTNLDTYSKLIYEALENKKGSLKTGNATINLPNEVGEVIERDNNMEEIFSAAVNAFECDNPDLFYLDASKMILYYERNAYGKYKIYLKNGEEYTNYLLDSFKNEEEIQNAQKQIDLVTEEILYETRNMNNDYEKVLYVHDWLTSNVKYDETINRENKDTIYGALIEKEAVCGGYANAFKYLMDKLNIESIIIQGIATNEQGQENHAWNYVRLNDKWYGIDCTWDDPIIVGDLTYYTEKKYYTYFLKGQNAFYNNHKPFETFYETDLRINYPKLSIEDY